MISEHASPTAACVPSPPALHATSAATEPSGLLPSPTAGTAQTVAWLIVLEPLCIAAGPSAHGRSSHTSQPKTIIRVGTAHHLHRSLELGAWPIPRDPGPTFSRGDLRGDARRNKAHPIRQAHVQPTCWRDRCWVVRS